MDKTRLRQFSESVRDFLLHGWSRQFLLFLFFVVVSAVFWLMQTLEISYDMKVDLPLVLSNVPSEVVITSEPPQKLQVTIHDKGINLLHYYVSLRKRQVQINYNVYDKGRAYGRIIVPSTDLRKQIIPWLDATTTIQSMHPDTVDFHYSRGVKKRLPVKLTGSITADSHHFLASCSCHPDSVTIWGAEDILDTLTAIPTKEVNLAGLNQSAKQTVRLADIWGAKTEPEEVSLYVSVDTYVEKSVNVKIAGVNFPAGKTLKTFPAEVSLRFHIGAAAYHSIVADSFVVGITYQEIKDMPANATHFQPVLRYAPSSVKNIDIVPSTVEFLIEEDAGH